MDTREKLLERVQHIGPTGRKTRLVAIDGRGGAGKSSLAGWLASQVDGTVIHVDDFGRPGAPYDDWDWHRLRTQVLEPLRADRDCRYQRYDWAADGLGEWVDLRASGIVIVEGVTVLREALGDLWDLKVWVETPYDLRLERGVERDGETERETWVTWWMPQEDIYIERESPMGRADIVISGY